MNYSSEEINKIKGVKGSQIGKMLAYADSEFVAFRENIALWKFEQSAPSTPPLGGEGGLNGHKIAHSSPRSEERIL